MNVETMTVTLPDESITISIPEETEVITTLSIPELIKGEKGDTPVKGVDYFTEEEVAEVEEQIKKDLEIPDLEPYALKEDLPTAVSELTNDAGYLTEELEPQFIEAKPTLALKSELPTKTSDLTNDSGFLTEHQSLDEYAKTANLATVATSGSYNDLTDKPEITGGASTASEVSFDDTLAGTGADNVQDAIEALADDATTSETVQDQIDTTFLSWFGSGLVHTQANIAYVVKDNPSSTKFPASIIHITESDAASITSIQTLLQKYPKFYSSSWYYTGGMVFHWEAASKKIGGNSSNLNNAILLQNHYYYIVGEKVKGVDTTSFKKKNIYNIYGRTAGVIPESDVLFTIPTLPIGGLTQIYDAHTGATNKDYLEYALYDVTPFFQIAQHETAIAALPDLSDYYTKTEIDNSGFIKENDLSDVAASGDYNDLINKPTIPSLTGYATEEWVESKGYLTEHQSLTAYAKKTDLPTNVSELTNDAGYLTTHQSLADYAKTADVTTAISTHNSSAEAHSDIRDLVAGLTTRLNALADSDDETLDQLSEIVAYIKSNRELIESITTDKVNVADIIDNLTTNVANKPLSAKQGMELKALIDAITVPTKVSDLTNDAGYLTEHQSLAEYAKSADLSNVATSGSYNDLADKPTIPSLTGYATENWVESQGYLTQHQSLTGYAKTADLASVATSGSYADLTGKPTAVSSFTNDAGYLTEHQDISDLVPEERRINGKALTTDITLNAADVGATTQAYVDSLQPVVVTGTLAAGSTSIELSNTAITTEKTFDFYTDTFGINPKSVEVIAGKITLTFDELESNLGVKVEVK